MSDPARPAPTVAGPRIDLQRDAVAMALHVALVLLAAWSRCPPEDVAHRVVVAAAAWGTAGIIALAGFATARCAWS